MWPNLGLAFLQQSLLARYWTAMKHSCAASKQDYRANHEDITQTECATALMWSFRSGSFNYDVVDRHFNSNLHHVLQTNLDFFSAHEVAKAHHLSKQHRSGTHRKLQLLCTISSNTHNIILLLVVPYLENLDPCFDWMSFTYRNASKICFGTSLAFDAKL